MLLQAAQKIEIGLATFGLTGNWCRYLD